MAVIFPRWTNYVPHALTLGAVGALAAVTFAVWYWFSPWYTDVGYSPVQPIAFSHWRHAGDLGIDCRYCHNTVEISAYAAVPPAQTCMSCHERILPESPLLAPLRAAYKADDAIPWKRVHMLPDYAFFDHSVHVAAAVGCVSCHGRLDQMSVVRQENPLSMSWCLDCHRNPAPNLRPRAEVTNMAWSASNAGYNPEADPGRARPVAPPEHCSGCHR
ncbi:MAG: cytochrome c3 family protein [Candidatus Schekmanbacteria bacterium]|nr:cytochrome c3 family protein [Candidatus Schekmanbacteria bacterium]